MAREERRLAAILATDVVGYSRLVGRDESGTVQRLRDVRTRLIEPILALHKGRIVKLTGDGALIEFASAVEALAATISIQQALHDDESASAKDSALVLRCGLHLGDVIVADEDIYGDGVNIAARLEAEAPPGGILISRTVQEAVLGRLPCDFEDRGELALKNIDRPVEVYRVTWRAEDWPAAAPIKAGEQKASSGLALPDKPSIAVLPFDSMSKGDDQEYLADGVVESITATLSRIREFFVIARNSAFAYKGRPKNVREIGQELGVGYVLEGSVQCIANRVRITVQLIETANGTHLWAEKFDGSLDDIFDLQDHITAQVAGALQPSIRLAEIEKARRKRPQELGAYGYTMRAMQHVWLLEKDEANKGLELLGEALKIDPDYPLALALAAWCWAQRSVYNWWDDPSEAKDEALKLADRAARQSGEDPLILTVVGTVHTFARNYGVARVLLERALAIDPNSAWAECRLGWLDVYSDQGEKAKEHFERALRLSPLDPLNFNNYVGIGSACQTLGDDAGASEYFARAIEERPNALWILRNMAAALLGAGRIEEAKAAIKKVLQTYPDFCLKRFREAMVFTDKTQSRICDQLRQLGVPEG